MKDYNPASVWSAPEILRSAKLLDSTKEMDVYSFGIILWEILHDQVPFDNDLNLAKNFVLNEDARPQISENVEVDIARLIRLCWQNDPDKRPHFSIIYAKMKEN